MAATCWVWLVLPLQLPWGHLSDLRLAETSGPPKKCVCLYYRLQVVRSAPRVRASFLFVFPCFYLLLLQITGF
jgi:hypothetical protein